MTAARKLDVFDPRTLGAKCDVCPLKHSRPVPSSGPLVGKAKFVILGESPGRIEEKDGKPFIGPSGKLLTKLLDEVDLDRDDAFVTNTILCRPTEDEQIGPAQHCCAPRLFRELRELPPSAPMLALGAHSMKQLVGVRSIQRTRGFVWHVPTLDAATKKKLRSALGKGKAKKGKKPKKSKSAAVRLGARLRLMRNTLAGRVVFPALHPAFILRSEMWNGVMRVDIDRMARWLRSGGLELEDKAPFVVVDSAKKLRKLGRKLAPIIACDIETDSINVFTANITCVGIGDENLTIVAYPWKPEMAKVLTEICATRVTVGHNFFNFDVPVLGRHGVKLKRAKLEDTLIAHHSFASHLPKSLLHVVSINCDASPWKHEAKGEGKTEKGAPSHIDRMTPQQLTAYNASDTRLTILSWHRMQGDLKPELHTYRSDKRIAWLCMEMQQEGFAFDAVRAKKLSRLLLRRADKLMQKLRKLTKRADFDPSKPNHIRKALFDQFGCLLIHPTKTGLPSTARNILEALRKGQDKAGRLSDLVLKWRSAMKAESTFLKPHVEADGRVHAGWRIGPQTGRLACKTPNLMQLPRYAANDITTRARECYVAKTGFRLVYFDLSQAELRFAAHVANDDVFIEMSKHDGHAGNAKVLFPEADAQGWLDGAAVKDPTKGKPFRDIAKNAGFGVTYLAGWETVYAFLISKGFAVSPADVRAMLRRFHESYAKYYAYVAKNVEFVKRHGYLRTVGARRIRWMGHYPQPTEVANFPIQGGIADLMNERLWKLRVALRKLCRRAKAKVAYLIAQIHDAAIIETREDYVDDVKKLIDDIYGKPVELPDRPGFIVPVEKKTGDRWSSLG
jgi:uracil-DNA glycosylase family 4